MADPQSTKQCRECWLVLPCSAFTRQSASRDGLGRICRSCSSKIQKDYYARNTEVQKAAHRNRYAAKRGAIGAATDCKCEVCGAAFVNIDDRKAGRFCSEACRAGTLTQRFWRHVGPILRIDACWLWTGYLDEHGYGRLKDGGTMVGAHRVAYEFLYGPLGELFACHRCDTPPCVNPFHLFGGTAAENTGDMITKGRKAIVSVPGEANGNARLTEAAVREIKASAESQRSLAARFGVGKTTIARIQAGETWSWLTS